MADLKELADAIIKGDQDAAVEITKAALDEGIKAKRVLKKGVVAGMEVVGKRARRWEIFVPDMLVAKRAMERTMEILEPELEKAGVKPVGTLVIGTVQGDLHDIGKNLVAALLKGAHFKVCDVGIDVSPEKFVKEADTTGADLVGMSALLTTTMPGMEKTIKALKEAGITAKTIIGGAGVTQMYADKIGADGYAPDAGSAVKEAKKLLGIGLLVKISLWFRRFLKREIDAQQPKVTICEQKRDINEHNQICANLLLQFFGTG